MTILEHYITTLCLLRGGAKDKKKKKKGSPPASPQGSFNALPPPNPPSLPANPASPPPKPPSLPQPPTKALPNPASGSAKPNAPSNPLLSLRSNALNINFPPKGSKGSNPIPTPNVSQTPTYYPKHAGLYTRLMVILKLRDKDNPSRAAPWRTGYEQRQTGVYGYARATKTNKKGKREVCGPVGLAVDRTKLNKTVLQDYGQQFPGRGIDYPGKYKHDYGKKFWYVPLKRDEFDSDDDKKGSDKGSKKGSKSGSDSD